MDFPADPDRVFAMVTDPEFQASVAERVDATSHTLSVDGSSVKVVRVLNAPAKLAAIVGSEVAIVEGVDWDSPAADGTRHGRLHVEVTGKPVTWKGQASLTGNDGSTTLTYSGPLTVAIPVLGKALEKQAAQLLADMVAVQQEVGRDYLQAG